MERDWVYFRCDGNTQKGFKQENNVMLFLFWKDHFHCSVVSRLEESRVAAERPVRGWGLRQGIHLGKRRWGKWATVWRWNQQGLMMERRHVTWAAWGAGGGVAPGEQTFDISPGWYRRRRRKNTGCTLSQDSWLWVTEACIKLAWARGRMEQQSTNSGWAVSWASETIGARPCSPYLSPLPHSVWGS